MTNRTCQKYSVDARAMEPESRLPWAAAQPISGGMAPTTAPTHVLLMLTCGTLQTSQSAGCS